MLPGHGEPITDHRRADRRALRACTERRAEKIFGLIAERPRTGYEIAQELWGNVAVTQAFLTLSEVIGHVDLLIDEGRVREVADGDVVRFEARRVTCRRGGRLEQCHAELRVTIDAPPRTEAVRERRRRRPSARRRSGC